MSATGPKIVAVGEILWDLLPDGRQMGGAPTNFACHAHALGASSYLISRVGNDPLGRELLARLSEMQLATEGVSVDPVKPTGTVPVELAPGGQPTFLIREDVAWDYLEANSASIQVAAAADAICFGSLAQRHEVSRAAIHAVVSAARPEALRVFDVNLRQNFYSRA
ncbi:MAG TPA: carbohydrate kinase, partial [Verrucomicrobiales bacterium]|nr:carbohydrate kinase [Verrucomicrobiales bacterium]